jgi:hypothetical protein
MQTSTQPAKSAKATKVEPIVAYKEFLPLRKVARVNFDTHTHAVVVGYYQIRPNGRTCGRTCSTRQCLPN